MSPSPRAGRPRLEYRRGGIDSVPPLTPNTNFPQLADFSPDSLLTRDAQAGEVAALGCLLSRYQAEFANSGHMPHFEEPAEFAAAILKVLS